MRLRAESLRTGAVALGVAATLYLGLVAVLLSLETGMVYAPEYSRREMDTTVAERWERITVPTTDRKSVV